MNMNKEVSISGLYYRYKKTNDEKLKEYLQKYPIVRLESKGAGTVEQYYPLSKAALAKIIEKPRNVSLTFDATNTSDKPLTKLKEWKRITYLVKSSSRFFLKPDAGEIFDQIDFNDFYDSEFKAICFLDDYETLPDTEGEHFLMTAVLLTNE